MKFCALTTDQHKALYKLLYKTVTTEKNFNLKNLSAALFNRVYKGTKNYDLALTYVSFVPSYVSSLQAKEKDFRAIVKQSGIDANELLDRIDEWDNNLEKVEEFLGTKPLEGTTEPVIPTSGPTIIDTPPPAGPTQEIIGEPDENFLNEVRRRIQLEEEALEEEKTIEEKFKEKDLLAENNRINDAYTIAKNLGKMFFITSNPQEKVNDGEIKAATEDLEAIRKKFLEELSTGKKDSDDYRLMLKLSNAGNIYSVLTDKDGKLIDFNGKFLSFYMDYDLYSKEYLKKRRNEVVKFGDVAPLTSLPLTPHASFSLVEDPIEKLKQIIAKKNILGKIEFTTQGMLFREGISNNLGDIPKNKPTKSAAYLIDQGHTVGKKGDIPIISGPVMGTYQRANRIHFALMRNLADKSAGYEMVEFRPTSLRNAKMSDGSNLVDSLKVDIAGKEFSIFEAAHLGILPSTKQHVDILQSLLRRDKFMVMDLGSHIIVMNYKNFKKISTKKDITAADIRATTSLDEMLDSEMNILQARYRDDIQVDIPGETNYVNFVNQNVFTSANPVRMAGNIQGYTRINKRIGVTLEQTFQDMIKEDNQSDITDIDVIEKVSEEDAMKLIQEGMQEDFSEDLTEGLTKTDCP